MRAGHRLRQFLSLCQMIWRFVSSEVSYRLAAGDVADQVTARRDGAIPLGDRVCVFVHFDSRGQIWPHTRRYLSELHKLGIGIVVRQQFRQSAT